MTESVQDPMGFSAPNRRARLRPSVEDQLLTVHKQDRRYKNTINRLVPEGHGDDVWQEAILRLTVFLQGGREIDRIGAYMHQVCVNAARDHMRAIRKRAEDLTASDSVVFERENIQVLADMDVDLRYGDIHKVLVEELTVMEHRAYYLTVVHGMTSKEISKLLGPSATCVRKALARARDKLSDPEVVRRFDYRPRHSG